MESLLHPHQEIPRTVTQCRHSRCDSADLENSTIDTDRREVEMSGDLKEDGLIGGEAGTGP
jgi:hypothetical protein